MSKNPIAKNMNKVNKPSTIPNKKKEEPKLYGTTFTDLIIDEVSSWSDSSDSSSSDCGSDSGGGCD